MNPSLNGQILLNEDQGEILSTLQEGEIKLTGQFTQSSNYTFLVEVIHKEQALKAVYKPQKGERPLWDFPPGTLGKREVAAYLVSQGLGWNLVPATIFRKKAPLGRGSLQQYIEHDPEKHYFTFDASTRARLKPAAVFDLILNNADRKGGHILLDGRDQLWLVDHGVCFHPENKLRTVIWDFAGQPIPAEILRDLKLFEEKLCPEADLYQEFLCWLSVSELKAMIKRIKALLQMGMFPFPDVKRRPYPWPPL